MRGDEPYRTLIELSAMPELEGERARLLRLAEEQASNDCEGTFTIEDVYRWERACLQEPKPRMTFFVSLFAGLRLSNEIWSKGISASETYFM